MENEPSTALHTELSDPTVIPNFTAGAASIQDARALSPPATASQGPVAIQNLGVTGNEASLQGDRTTLLSISPPPLRIESALGTLDLRTPAEDLEFQICENLIQQGCQTFLGVGAALARIRDGRLYKNEYTNFEEYCRMRWGFRRTKVWALIAAAQVVKLLENLPGTPLPRCEAHVRPLIGLSPELAQQAWLETLGTTPAEQLTARHVRRVVNRLKRDQPAVDAQPQPSRQQRYKVKQSIRASFGELLTLILAHEKHEVLLGKVQALERLLDPILRPRKKQR